LGVVGSGLFWLVIALSAMTAWMLIGNWRHTREGCKRSRPWCRKRTFRRAMENSMLTGMRAMDLQGRITYVNAAFCQMTGWTEADLVGRTAPFPYWPENPTAKRWLPLGRRTGGQFNPAAFRCVSNAGITACLMPAVRVTPDRLAGQKTGWMTSMTDITEPNRIREQLSASHERFTTVLEALDASISVAPLGSDELLFANKLYRVVWHPNGKGHLQLVAQAGVPTPPTRTNPATAWTLLPGCPPCLPADAETESAEIFLAEHDKWLEVRTPLPELGGRASGADGDCHRHHRAPSGRGAGRPRPSAPRQPAA
jgi:PAS domain S-box-containing protein